MTDLTDRKTAPASSRSACHPRRIFGGPGMPPRLPILMYHQIAANPPGARHLAVTPGDFAQQLAYLHANGYTTLTMADLVHATAGRTGQWPAKPVVLTFDDGFADFHDAALPQLVRHGFTATVFVTTGWTADAAARSDRRAPDRMLCWSQIRESAAAGIEIGAHTHRHPQLDQLTAGVLREELDDSKALLEDGLGQPVTGLAYPFGYSNSRVRAAASAAGYEYACAVGNRLIGRHADRFTLPRLTIGRRTSLPNFIQIVRGDRLPPEFLAYRTMTAGWSAVRHVRSMLNRIAQ